MNQLAASDKAGLAVRNRARFVGALTGLATISAAVDISAGYFGPQTNVYIFKPLTMVFIIVIAATGVTHARNDYRNLIVIGLCCSMVGDVFLMLPSDQFVAGLVSFLIAHLFYLAAFRTRPARWSSAWWGIACVLYGALMFWLLYPRLGDMRLPVLIYLVVILVMAWQALARWSAKRRPGVGVGVAAVGAVLFVASDSLIAIDRFYSRFHLAELLILATYFTAQCLFALSIRCGDAGQSE